MSTVAARLPVPSLEELVARAGQENFPVALRLAGKEAGRHLLAIYGYARLVDDVGDELAGSAQDRLAVLDAVEAELDAACSGRPTHPVFCRLAATIAECRLDRSHFADLLEANRVDQAVARYETFDELLGYCRLSANPVGRLVLGVFGCGTEEQCSLSDLVCSGLQVVEHLQDVAEDAARGRVYVPAEDFDRYGVPRDLLAMPISYRTAPDSFRRMMAFEVTRARRMLREGARLVGLVPPRASLAIAGFAGGGLAQLDAIEHASYDVLAVQVKASRAAVLARALRLLALRGRD